MRLAVFTSKYPARVATFFERDMRALVAAGVEIDVFPIHPLDETMWRYAQPILSADVLPRDRVHHLGFLRSLGSLGRPSVRRLTRFLPDAAAVTAAALLEPGYFRVEPEFDAKAPRVAYEPCDEVLLEML